MPARECRINGDIYKIAEPFCIEAHQINGNDVLQVYEAAKGALDKCRNGEGPVFIEFLTYRFRGHVGPDDNIQGAHTDIRPKEEIEQWLQKDPIKRFESYLLAQDLIDAMQLRKIKEEAQREVDEAHAFAKNSPSPNQQELVKYVYKKKARI
jgi:pyruvate dehydrogenase E1 component alpha subunit